MTGIVQMNNLGGKAHSNHFLQLGLGIYLHVFTLWPMGMGCKNKLLIKFDSLHF
jgi:hypothetical protein